MEYRISRYVIVQFHDLPHIEMDPIQCVPNGWLNRFENGFVMIAFPPTNDEDIINGLVENNARSRGEWVLCKAHILDGKGTYSNAYRRLFELRREHAPPQVEEPRRKLDKAMVIKQDNEFKNSKYVIVQLQELPNFEIDPIQCVLNKWINRFEDDFVITAFPPTNDADTIDELVEKDGNSRGDWSLYEAHILSGKILYKNAFRRLFELRVGRGR